MPIGFAKSILAQGTTATGANAFVDWDGTNDNTLTRNAAVDQWIGFAPFNSEYGVMVIAVDSGADQIMYDVIRNNSGTLSITSQQNSLTTTSTSDYTDFGLVAPTQGGKVIYDGVSVGTSAYKVFSISGSTVSVSDGVTSGRTQHNNPLFVERTGESNAYNNLRHGGTSNAEKVTTTDEFASNESVTTETQSNVSYFYGQNRFVPGFVDKDTIVAINSTDSGDTFQPFKIDLTQTGPQTPGTFSGSPSSVDISIYDSANSTNFLSNVFDYAKFATPQFNDTSFNDTAFVIRREGGGASNKFMVESYKANDSSFNRSNVLTLSAGGSSDTSATGCFVGANNDVYLFANFDIGSNRIIVCKFVLSTNTLSEVLNFTITRHSDVAENAVVRLHRWGDDGALMTYNENKIRLIKP